VNFWNETESSITLGCNNNNNNNKQQQLNGSDSKLQQNKQEILQSSPPFEASFSTPQNDISSMQLASLTKQVELLTAIVMKMQTQLDRIEHQCEQKEDEDSKFENINETNTRK